MIADAAGGEARPRQAHQGLGDQAQRGAVLQVSERQGARAPSEGQTPGLQYLLLDVPVLQVVAAATVLERRSLPVASHLLCWLFLLDTESSFSGP